MQSHESIGPPRPTTFSSPRDDDIAYFFSISLRRGIIQRERAAREWAKRVRSAEDAGYYNFHIESTFIANRKSNRAKPSFRNKMPRSLTGINELLSDCGVRIHACAT